MSDSLPPHEPQHARPPCPSSIPRVHPNPCPLSQWCHPTISSSVVPFSPCPQSFPASGSFQMSQLFASGGQSTGVSASTSVLPMNTQEWSLEWTGWISLQSKGLSRVFNTTVQKHQFFGAQPSLQSNSHIHTWLLEKPSVQLSHSVVSDSLRPHGLQHARFPCPSKHWSFSFCPSNEYSGLISFRIDWCYLPAIQGTLKSLLQHLSLKVSILGLSTFFMVQLSHPYMTTGKTLALTIWTFVNRVLSLWIL